jgi:tight adherence protein C
VEESSVWIFTLAVAVASISLVWAGAASFAAMLNPVRRRLRALRQSDEGMSVASGGAVRPGAQRMWSVFEPKKEAEREGLRLRLVQAGFRSATALGLVYAMKLVCALVLPVLALSALSLSSRVHMPMLGWVAAGLVAAFIGSLLPDLFLIRRFENRKVQLMEGLPDALDLLVTCTEAGLGLNAALERVVQQMPGSHPELAQELGMVNAEVRAGIDRNTALKNLGDRTGLDEIHGLVSLITHSTRLGTGIAATLRIYAEDFRDRRMQRAEELAATVGTKLIFPLVLCMFPSFFVVAVGPAILAVMKVMSGTG